MNYDQPSIEYISKHLNKSIEEVLETYEDKVLFIPFPNNQNFGRAIKESKCSNVKLDAHIEVPDATYVKLNGNEILGVSNDISKIKWVTIDELKKEKTEKELNSKNILKGIKMIAELFDIDPDSTMEQLKYMNEKIRMRNKLIEEGFETKEQRKHVHNALKYCAKNIKLKGSDGAADDTAEKYRIEAKMIKHLRGFHNRLFANPFK